jgi:lysophospholipase L1-like esterase
MARTLVVGDSLGVGTAPYLRSRGGVRGDSRVGRPSSEGVAVLRQRLRRGHRAVVFDLGTNDASAGELRQSLRQARRLVGDRELYVSTVNGPDAAAKNALLKRFARRSPNIHLVRGAQRVATGPDGIHPTASGYRVRGALYSRALARNRGSGAAASAVSVARAGGQASAARARPRPRGGVVDLPGYTPEQDRVISEIISTGDERNADRWEILSGLMTGGAESTWRNLSYGDADSEGWRQERQSLYRNPRNLRASTSRYFDEAREFRGGRRERPGELAQLVQGSAFPSRYYDFADQARDILGAYRSRAGSPSRGGGSVTRQPSVSRGAPLEGSGGLVAALAALRERQSQPALPSGGLSRPAFAAGPAMPKGHRSVEGGGMVAPPDESFDEALRAVAGLEGAAPPRSTVEPGTVAGGREGAAGGGSGGGQLRSAKDGWYGTKTAIEPAREIAADMGIGVLSEKRERKFTSTGNVSDHWEGNKLAYALDLDAPGIDSADGFKLARRVAKAYGVKFVPNSYASGGTVRIDGRTFRVQILYGSGVDHGDHVHVGLERIL